MLVPVSTYKPKLLSLLGFILSMGGFLSVHCQQGKADLFSISTKEGWAISQKMIQVSKIDFIHG